MFYVTLIGIISLTNAALETPPHIIDAFKPEYYAAESEEMKFQCTATGNPQPSVYWKFNGIRMPSTDRKKIYDNGTLHIVKVQNDPKAVAVDFGRYQCFAVSKLGLAMGTSFFLMESKNLPFTKMPGGEVEGIEGEAAEIRCLGQNTCVPRESCKVSWKIGDTKSKPVNISERISIDSEGTLHFSYLEKDDEQMSDTEFYTCESRNEDIKNSEKGPPMKLKVVVPNTKVERRDPVLVLGSGRVKALIGDNAELLCIFKGKPVMKYISWFKKTKTWGAEIRLDTEGPKYLSTDFGRKLIITNVQENDEAMYICKANNGYNRSKESSGTNYLIVQSPPIFLKPNGEPKALTLPEGRDATFNCETRSLPREPPPDTPVWYRNGQLMTGDTSKFVFNADRTKLIIKNVERPIKSPSYQPKDVGTYVCSVTNRNGTVYGSGSLNVIEPINIIHDLPNSSVILPGEIKSMAVDATTDPELTLQYLWSFRDTKNRTFNQNDLSSRSDLYKFSDNNKNLTINADSLQGSQIYEVLGTYYVSLQHSFEEKILESKLETDSAIPPPKDGIVSSAGFDFWIIAIILGILILLIVILLLCCLCYRNRGGTYLVDKKEVEAGHDPEKELKDSGFHDLSKADDHDNPAYDNVSLASVKQPESDEESMGEYDLDISKFNEDGSFIGLYTDKKPLTQSMV